MDTYNTPTQHNNIMCLCLQNFILLLVNVNRYRRVYEISISKTENVLWKFYTFGFVSTFFPTRHMSMINFQKFISKLSFNITIELNVF